MNIPDAAGKLIGIGGGSDRLAKMLIEVQKHQTSNDKIQVLFNPNKISRSRSVSWHRQRMAAYSNKWIGQGADQQFIGVNPETLSVSFFADTYESRVAPSGLRQNLSSFVNTANPFAQGDATDVRVHTERIAELALIDQDLHHPPVCRLSWGEQKEIFFGVLTSIKQEFTLFLPDGTPVRATLACTFTEFLTKPKRKRREPHSSDLVTTVVVRRGDTLQSIAAQHYRDPAQWRHIAKANGIVSPRALEPGRVLTVPKLAG